MRGVTRPVRVSVIGFPVARRMPTTSAAVRPGRAWRRRATAPATAGVAADVPAKPESVPDPFIATFQKAPGASSERFVVALEKQTTASGVAGSSVQSTPPLPSDQDTRLRLSE